MDPDSLPVPSSVLTATELVELKVAYSEVISVIKQFGGKIFTMVEGTPLLIMVTDKDGFIIEVLGDPVIMEMIDSLGIREGIQLSEESMGTNAVYLTLQNQRPFQLVGEDHYHKALFDSACYCAPFTFNHISGAVAIMTSKHHHSPFPLALLASLIDAMERELMLRNLNRNQRIINQLMVKSLKYGILITDAKGIVKECNEFTAELTNRVRQEVLNHPVFQFERLGNLFYEVLKNSRTYNDVELTFTNSLDRRRICLFDAVPIYDDANELIGAYAQLRDITDRYELERQIITSEKFSVVGKLAAGLAHEIRNPLTSVMGFIQLLRNTNTDQRYEYYLDIVYNELETVKKLVTDFVTMAKPSTPERKACLIDTVLQETIALMSSQAILKDCELRVISEPVNEIAYIDPVQIKQMLVNLIQNAMEAMPSGGIITIHAHMSSEQEVIIRISDDGIGMTDEEMKSIMNPFFTTKETGLGLGLSVCYRIIENHKGRLTFESQKGVGTTFTVTLPISNREGK